MTPNLERLQLLVNGLVSGEYPQTRGVLKRTQPITGDDRAVVPIGYCCLGTACEISAQGYWLDQPGQGRAAYMTDPVAPVRSGAGDREGANSPFYMPDVVADWYGVKKDIEFSFSSRGKETYSAAASHLNDADCTFAQIADCIAWEFGLEIPQAVTA